MSKYEELDALYAELPTVACQRKCWNYCGPILIPKIEAQRLEEKRGVLETIPIFEEKGWEPGIGKHLPTPESLRRDFIGLVPDGETKCVFLSLMGACMAYSIRPAVCRFWGVTDNEWMRCPFGCVPTRWMSNLEFKELLEKIVAIQNRRE
jgi:Fe-S-cluster containining protein